MTTGCAWNLDFHTLIIDILLKKKKIIMKRFFLKMTIINWEHSHCIYWGTENTYVEHLNVVET
jgi:hypothetical protein